LISSKNHAIREGEFTITVHAIGVNVDYCGMLFSGKIFLRLVQSVKKWGAARGSTRTLVQCDHRHELEGNRQAHAGNRGEMYRRRICGLGLGDNFSSSFGN